jgi:hypothetical protein
MRYELKSIGIWALIKVFFFFNLIVGFIAGIFYGLLFSFFMAVMANIPFARSEMPDINMPVGLTLVIMPFIFAIGAAVFHTLIFVILAFIYNLIAKLTGGMEFELNPVVEVTIPPAPPTTSYTPPPPPSTPPPPPPASPPQPMSPPPATQPPPSPGGTPPPIPPEAPPPGEDDIKNE